MCDCKYSWHQNGLETQLRLNSVLEENNTVLLLALEANEAANNLVVFDPTVFDVKAIVGFYKGDLFEDRKDLFRVAWKGYGR